MWYVVYVKLIIYISIVPDTLYFTVSIQLWVVLCYFKQFPVEVSPQRRSDDWMTVFGREDEMIITEVHTVIVSTVGLWYPHLLMVHQERSKRHGDSLHPHAYAMGYLRGIKSEIYSAICYSNRTEDHFCISWYEKKYISHARSDHMYMRGTVILNNQPHEYF